MELLYLFTHLQNAWLTDIASFCSSVVKAGVNPRVFQFHLLHVTAIDGGESTPCWKTAQGEDQL